MSDAAFRPLTEDQVNPDPLQQFRAWFAEAEAAGLYQPEAMTLATATADGRPAARAVLLRGADERGFTFFTNYTSRKGRELADNPRAALLFFWAELHRQVRVEGRIEVVSESESDDYFRTRPRGSQVGAWASEQSEVLPNREALDKAFEEMDRRFEGRPVPRPLHWGGYRVVPETIEFWQGRENRLHDRLCFRRRPGGGWDIVRLAP
jgi:pyridoxamine 5'-phosphate oxidase